MARPEVRDLGEGRKLLDLDFRDTEGLVAAYLLPEPEGWALVETGPTTCHAVLLRGIAEAGVDVRDVRHVFVTHIHLDHAGGVGALTDALPNATFLAHRVGVPHLVDPSRLVASARRAWGAASDPLWGPIVPVPPARLIALDGGERFPLQGGTLEAIATPGHARHHLSFYDDRLGAVFTGDSAGVRLERSTHLRPAVPPPDLDLEQLFASVDEMRRRNPRLVLFSHFGPSPDGPRDLERYRAIVEAWRDVALRAAQERADVGFITARLQEYDAESLAREGHRPSELDRESLVSGYELAAAGYLRYFETHGLVARERG
jgi:glyoxylase-like metal-dependent hydrolase (beta-lactamase superfamily II)